MPYKEIMTYMPEIIALKVSERAREPGQFLEQYSHGQLPEFWQKKRNAFIARTLAAYKLNPTRRRELSLIAWAYKV
jgi:hypothetical protein